MGFNCGIVGLPNVGKSTLFNALTNASVEAQNFPFTTIDPNTGIVAVPDERLDRVAEISRVPSAIPATITFVDIAGLIQGASQGEGLGNRFLSHIREVDAIGHVVRCFEDDGVVHVDGTVSPVRDIEIVNTELMLADLETTSRMRDKVAKLAGTGNKQARFEVTLFDRMIEQLERGLPVRSLELSEEEARTIQSWQLLSAKPVMYIANIDDSTAGDSSHWNAIQRLAAEENSECVFFFGAIESELQELTLEERGEILQELGLEKSGLERVIESGYRLLGLNHFFTTNEKEARAWTIKKNTTAPQAAGRIHSDFEKGFIRAEVVSYDDYVKSNGEQGAKSAGKWRLEGRDYIVQDGDVILFRFNV